MKKLIPFIGLALLGVTMNIDASVAAMTKKEAQPSPDEVFAAIAGPQSDSSSMSVNIELGMLKHGNANRAHVIGGNPSSVSSSAPTKGKTATTEPDYKPAFKAELLSTPAGSGWVYGVSFGYFDSGDHTTTQEDTTNSQLSPTIIDDFTTMIPTRCTKVQDTRKFKSTAIDLVIGKRKTVSHQGFSLSVNNLISYHKNEHTGTKQNYTAATTFHQTEGSSKATLMGAGAQFVASFGSPGKSGMYIENSMSARLLKQEADLEHKHHLSTGGTKTYGVHTSGTVNDGLVPHIQNHFKVAYTSNMGGKTVTGALGYRTDMYINDNQSYVWQNGGPESTTVQGFTVGAKAAF